MIVNDDDHDEDEFQDKLRDQLCSASKVINDKFTIDKWQKLRIKDLQFYLQSQFKLSNRACCEVLIKDENDSQKLRYPEPEYENKKLVIQMQKRIVFKTYINLILSFQMHDHFWANDNLPILPFNHKQNHLIIQIQCDPYQTTLQNLLNELSSDSRMANIQKVNEDKSQFTFFEKLKNNNSLCAILCDSTCDKMKTIQKQRLIIKDQFEQPLQELDIKDMNQINIIDIQIINQMMIPSQYEEEIDNQEQKLSEREIRTKLTNKVVNQSYLPLDVMNVLKQAFNSIEHLYDEKAVIFFGNTGCGKSTLILSLIYGPNSLQEMITQERRKVISMTEELNQFLKNHSGIEIGDDLSKSKTFLPKIDFLEYLLFVDVAGLHDSEGKLVEYVNRFMLRSLFQKLKEVKFILPISVHEFSESKAKGVREQLQELSNILGHNFDQMLPNVIPVVTKCNPRNQDGYDLEALKGQLYDSLLKIDNQQQQQSEIELNNDELLQKELREIAISDFSEQLIIYDPLERDIKNDPQDPESINWQVSRQQFLDIIHNNDALDTKQLKLPMSDLMLYEFSQALEGMRQQCIQIADNEFKKAWNQPHDSSLTYDFKNNSIVKQLFEILEFFDLHNLLDNALQQKKQFQSFIDQTNRNIQDALTHQQCDQKQKDMYMLKTKILNLNQDILSFNHDINIKSISIKCQELVQLMIELQKSIINLQKEEVKDAATNAENNLTAINCQHSIFDSIQSLIQADRLDAYFLFGYHLRKIDDYNDTFTKVFLLTESASQNEDVLKKIVLSNVFDQSNSQFPMKIDVRYKFKLMLDSKWRMVYSGINENLFIKRENNSYLDNFHFLLTEKGLEIGLMIKNEQKQNYEWLRLSTSHGKVLAQSDHNIMRFVDQSLNDYQKVKLTSSNRNVYKNHDATNWKIKHDSALNKFHIYLDYKEYANKPRLVSSKDPQNTIFFSECQATSQKLKGFDQVNQDSWSIVVTYNESLNKNLNDQRLERQNNKIDFQKISDEQKNELLMQIGNSLRRCSLNQVKAELNQFESLEIIDNKMHSKNSRLVVDASLPLDQQTSDQVDTFLEQTSQIYGRYSAIDIHISQQIQKGSAFKNIKQLRQVNKKHQLFNLMITPQISMDKRESMINLELAKQTSKNEQSFELKHDQGSILIIIYWNPLKETSIKMIKKFNKILIQQKQFWHNDVRIVALSIDKPEINLYKMIKSNHWSKIKFFYCNQSSFMSDYGIYQEPLIIIVDKSGYIIQKYEHYDYQEQWTEIINNVVSGNIEMFIDNFEENDRQILDQDIQDDDDGSIQDSQDLTIEVFQDAIQTFQDRLKQNWQLQNLIKENRKKMKAAHCKFVYKCIIDPNKMEGKDMSKQFELQLMLTGEKEIAKKVQKQIEYVLKMSQDADKFKHFDVHNHIQFTDDNLLSKDQVQKPSFHWISSSFVDDIMSDTNMSSFVNVSSSASDLLRQASQNYTLIKSKITNQNVEDDE